MDFSAWLDSTFANFDYSILTIFSYFQSNALNDFSEVITFFGSPIYTKLMMGIGLFLCFFKKTRKIGLALFIALVVGTIVTNGILKPLVMRPRPYMTYVNDKLYEWYLAAGAHIESRRSFPSGHTTVAFEISTVLFLNFKSKWRWFFPVFALLVAMTRLYFMVHYPTDVIVGMFIGILAGCIGFLITKKIKILH